MEKEFLRLGMPIRHKCDETLGQFSYSENGSLISIEKITKLESGSFSNGLQVFTEESKTPVYSGRRTWDLEINGRPYFEFAIVE